MSDWRQLYADTILETDNTKLRGRLADTEAAIATRLKELEKNHNGAREFREIKTAATRLNNLRVERLGTR
jgi:hypothetical protein